MLPLLLLLLLFCSFACRPFAAVVAMPVAAAPPPSQIELWQDARIFDAVEETIAGARRRVWVEMYEFGRTDLAADLLARRRQGLDVRVIVDPSVAVSRRLAERLKRLGLEVRFYPVDEARHQIDHVKLLLTDEQAVVGGMNWGRHSSHNHDYAFELRAATCLGRLARIFLQDWSFAGGQPAAAAAGGDGLAQTSPGDGIRRLLEGDLESVRRSIEAEIFVLTDPVVVAELVEARRRGALVRVLMDPNQDANLDAFDVLQGAGVGVRWFPVAPGEKLHAKAGLFDDTLLLGSANWSLGGLSVNHELDFQTQDAAAVSAFRTRFETDWSSAAP